MWGYSRVYYNDSSLPSFFVSLIQDDPGADKENSMLPPSGVVPSAKASEDNVIDNPYLRPIKKPKVRRKKWVGAHLNQQTHICHSGWCFRQSSQWFPPQRGAARDQRLLFLNAGTSTAVGFLYTDWLLLKITFVVFTVIFSTSTHFVNNIIV